MTSWLSNSMLMVIGLTAYISAWAAHEEYTAEQLRKFAQQADTIAAMQTFQKTFPQFRADNNLDSISKLKQALFQYYDKNFVQEYRESNGKPPDLTRAKALDEEAIALQYHYICANKASLGEKNHLDKANDKSKWTEAHARYHPILEKYSHDKNHLYDLFLIDATSGRIVYSVFKEIDFATNLMKGPYTKTALGRLFHTLIDPKNKDAVKTDTDAHYLPAYDGEVHLMGTPITDGETTIGVVIVRLPIW
jgi:methyl-accepting chemotaxis protein